MGHIWPYLPALGLNHKILVTGKQSDRQVDNDENIITLFAPRAMWAIANFQTMLMRGNSLNCNVLNMNATFCSALLRV